MICNRCGKELTENSMSANVKVDSCCYGKVNHTKNLVLCDDCKYTLLIMFTKFTPPPTPINNPEPDKTTNRPT